MAFQRATRLTFPLRGRGATKWWMRCMNCTVFFNALIRYAVALSAFRQTEMPPYKKGGIVILNSNQCEVEYHNYTEHYSVPAKDFEIVLSYITHKEFYNQQGNEEGYCHAKKKSDKLCRGKDKAELE